MAGPMIHATDDAGWLEACLAPIRDTRVAVFGDFCLDAYWLIDPDLSEVSVETGLPVRRVREQRYSLGGASNVAANLAALGVGEVCAVGMAGSDVFGTMLRAMLSERGVDCRGILTGDRDWQTFVFGKPCIGDDEQGRIDFGGFNRVTAESLDALSNALEAAVAASDAVILNQQIPGGTSPPETIARLNAIVKAHPDLPFIVDSRHRAERYDGCLLKLNTHEAARLLGEPRSLDERIPAAEARELAGRLHRRTGRAVFVTRGEDGMIAVDEGRVFEAPGIPIDGPVDTVGCGDTAVAAIAAVFGSGGDVAAAARLANLAASVTAQKLQTTGTATPGELRDAAPRGTADKSR